MLINIHEVVGRAAYIRHRCGFDKKGPSYSTTAVLTKCFPSIVVTGGDLPDGVNAISENRGGQRTIYYRRGIPSDEHRVAIAHEMYHFMSDLKNANGLRESSAVERSIAFLRRQSDPIEQACDLFAGELLVPLHVLDEYAPEDPFADGEDAEAVANAIDRCASRFQVPLWFMQWRLEALVLARSGHFNPDR